MQRRALASRGVIILVLILQLVPLVLFPPESFAPTTQEWWLPVLLAMMVLWADFELMVRRSDQTWPWYLMSFAQGVQHHQPDHDALATCDQGGGSSDCAQHAIRHSHVCGDGAICVSSVVHGIARCAAGPGEGIDRYG